MHTAYLYFSRSKSAGEVSEQHRSDVGGAVDSNIQKRDNFGAIKRQKFQVI